MAKDIGIQLNNDLGLNVRVVKDSSGMITSGLTVGNTLYQNQYLILQSQKGEFKEYPTLGVGINDMANDDDLTSWKKTIREELAKDGIKVNKLVLTSSGMSLDATY